MKRIVTVFVFLLLLNNVYSKELANNYKPKIDSLQGLLSLKNHDTTRLMLTHSLAQVYAYSLEFVKSVEMIHSAQELNKKLKFPKGYAAEYRSLACFFIRLPARNYFESYARWEFAKLKQKDDFFALNLDYPSTNKESEIKFFEIRIAQSKESLTYAKKVNNDKLVALIYDNLSANYFNIDDYNNAIVYADSTLDAWKKTNETSLSIYPLLLQNYCYDKLGNAIKAKEAEIKSNTILANLENPQEKMIYMTTMSKKYKDQQSYALCVEYGLKALEASISLNDTLLQIQNYVRLGSIYDEKSMSKKAIDNWEKAIEIYEKNKKKEYYFIRTTYYNLGRLYVELKEYDLAKKYFAGTTALYQLTNDMRQGNSTRLKSEGLILLGQEMYLEALAKFFEASKFEDDTINKSPITNYRIAFCYHKLGNLKKSILYGERSYKAAEKGDKKLLLETSKLLEEVYKQNNQPSKVYEYLQIHDKILSDNAAEEIFNNIADAEIKTIIDKSKQEKQKLEQEKTQKIRESKMQRWLIFSIALAFLSALVILYMLNRNNHQKQAANQILEKTLFNLKSTQAQLIQSEKLASLGELTAGIAHEIQNPLNFVNNFSELSVDLVKDLKDELKRTDKDEVYIDELFDDLSQNQEKINHHGKRASSIVKGMLEHSRASTGVKESADINKLADEYLRLSYHGLRAKDKSFNVDFKTDFDVNLPKITVIPQDLGRVLLNLINNAFYAVNKRKQNVGEVSNLADVERQNVGEVQNLADVGVNYTPSVIVSTQQLDNQIIIKITDNGIGMPESVKAKIFQPFFTTKPTGEGTGLGLSLAYDIVTKGHSGTLEVVSTEGVGTEFIIRLPTVL